MRHFSGKKYPRASLVAAKMDHSIVASMQYKGTMDSSLFEKWFQEMLVSSLPRGSTIVMDNASFHKKRILAAMASAAHCRLAFLPPYSPEFNPIESLWAWLKNRLRSTLHLFPSFQHALVDCFYVE